MEELNLIRIQAESKIASLDEQLIKSSLVQTMTPAKMQEDRLRVLESDFELLQKACDEKLGSFAEENGKLQSEVYVVLLLFLLIANFLLQISLSYFV